MQIKKEAEFIITDLTNPDFEFENGLWEEKDEKELAEAIVIRGTNFSEMGDFKGEMLKLMVSKKKLHKKKLVEGDILIERSGGGPKQPVGRVAFFDINKREKIYSFSNFITRLRVKNKDILYPKYVFFKMLHFYKFNIGDTFQHGSTGIRNLDFKKYKAELKIEILPLPEQKKIAEVLGKVQYAVEKQKELIEKLKELKSATMAKLFKYGLNGKPLKKTEIGEIPEDWEVVRLGDVCDITSGGTPSKTKKEYWENGNIPWIKSGQCDDKIINKIEDYITELGFNSSSTKMLKPNTTLVAMVGATIGKTGYLTFEACTNQNIAGIYPLNNKELYPLYVFYAMQNNYKNFASLQGFTIANLSFIKNMQMVKPEYTEQKKIADILSKIDRQIEISEEKLKYFNEFFNSSLNLLMTGKVRLV